MVLPLLPLAASALSAGQALAGQASASLSRTLGAHHAARTGVTSDASQQDAKAKKTSDDFESMFLEQSLDRLNNSEGTEGPLGENGTGGGVYRSMLTKEYAGQIVKSGGVGISGQVYGEILKLQGAKS